MIMHGDSHIYVSDFVKFEHPTLGTSFGKVLSYYQKVPAMNYNLLNCTLINATRKVIL